MLKAEEEGLLKVEITVPDVQVADFTGALVRCCLAQDYGELSTTWNAFREEVCKTVVNNTYIPAAAKWAKEHLRTKAEEFVAARCRAELEFVSRESRRHENGL